MLIGSIIRNFPSGFRDCQVLGVFLGFWQFFSSFSSLCLRRGFIDQMEQDSSLEGKGGIFPENLRLELDLGISTARAGFVKGKKSHSQKSIGVNK
jgi:hypothetical protein